MVDRKLQEAHAKQCEGCVVLMAWAFLQVFVIAFGFWLISKIAEPEPFPYIETLQRLAVIGILILFIFGPKWKGK